MSLKRDIVYHRNFHITLKLIKTDGLVCPTVYTYHKINHRDNKRIIKIFIEINLANFENTLG